MKNLDQAEDLLGRQNRIEVDFLGIDHAVRRLIDPGLTSPPVGLGNGLPSSSSSSMKLFVSGSDVLVSYWSASTASKSVVLGMCSGGVAKR